MARDTDRSAAAPAEASASAASPLLPAQTNGQPAGGGVQILVISGDAAVGQLIRATLAPQGFQVTSASDEATLADALTRQPYHVVIVDERWPGQAVHGLLDRVRQEQPAARIIDIGAVAETNGKRHPPGTQVHGTLAAPFAPSQLHDAVRRCLEGTGLLRLSEEALRENLGAMIRERRKALGLTLALLAERTNLSLGYLSQIELGKNSASVETLYRICLGLSIRVSDLFASIRV